MLPKARGYEPAFHESKPELHAESQHGGGDRALQNQRHVRQSRHRACGEITSQEPLPGESPSYLLFRHLAVMMESCSVGCGARVDSSDTAA